MVFLLVVGVAVSMWYGLKRHSEPKEAADSQQTRTELTNVPSPSLKPSLRTPDHASRSDLLRPNSSPSLSNPSPTLAQSQNSQKPSPNPPDTRQLTYGDPGSNLSIPEVRKPEPTDYSRIFSGKEVDSKARVLAKPEPTYTEAARKNQITATVVLRAVFSSSGQGTNIHAVSGLPDGLTERAIAAAKQIRFVPAQKDGHPVSMWMESQYNFNGY